MQRTIKNVCALMYHYILYKLMKYFVCSENCTSETPVFTLSLFYVFIYAVLQLSLCEKNNAMCVCVCVLVLRAVERINGAIRKGVPEETVNELMNPDAQLPQVYPSAADLYQRELASLQQQSAEVKTQSLLILAHYLALTIFLMRQ